MEISLRMRSETFLCLSIPVSESEEPGYRVFQSNRLAVRSLGQTSLGTVPCFHFDNTGRGGQNRRLSSFADDETNTVFWFAKVSVAEQE
jgi:hypothetical protein